MLLLASSSLGLYGHQAPENLFAPLYLPTKSANKRRKEALERRPKDFAKVVSSKGLMIDAVAYIVIY